MQTNSFIYPAKIGLATLTCALAVPVAEVGIDIMPSKNIELNIQPFAQQLGEHFSNYTYSVITEDSLEILRKLGIIQKFASKLLKESIDLEPHVAKVINKNFRTLIS